MVANCCGVGQAGQPLEEAVDVDDLVDEDVGTVGQTDDVVARPGVAGEGDRTVRCVEAEPEGGEHRSVLHERRAHADPAVVLGVDHDRVHRRGRGSGRAGVGHDAEVDVGRVAVATHADLVHAERVGDVVAALVGDSQIDVVGERPQQMVHRPTDAGCWLVAERQRAIGRRGNVGIGSPAGPGP